MKSHLFIFLCPFFIIVQASSLFGWNQQEVADLSKNSIDCNFNWTNVYAGDTFPASNSRNIQLSSAISNYDQLGERNIAKSHFLWDYGYFLNIKKSKALLINSIVYPLLKGTTSLNAGTPSIVTSSFTGNISTCYGIPSAIPNIGQFSISGSDVISDVVINAPQGFEISLTNNSGYAKVITVPQLGGTVANTIIYVRLSAIAPVGINSGVVGVSSGSASSSILVTGLVHALPNVVQVTNQTVSNGSLTAAINFTGTGNTYLWTNDTPGIGLASSGDGDITSFKAVNKGNTPITAHIKVVPASQGYAYIPDYTSGNILVYNTSTNLLERTIKVDDYPSPITVSPDGLRVYVGNNNFTNDKPTISVINSATKTVIADINVGIFPSGLAVSPDNSRLYVVNDVGGTLTIINTATNNIISTILIGLSAAPKDVIVSPDGKTVYTVDQNYNNVGLSVAEFNTVNNKITAEISLGANPTPNQTNPAGVALSPDGSRLYIANGTTEAVTVINTITNTIINNIPVSENPAGTAISPDGKTLYVPDYYDSNVNVIDLANGKVTSKISLGNNTNPTAITISSDGTLIYVQCMNAVLVINTFSHSIIAELPIADSYQSNDNDDILQTGTGCTGPPIYFNITVLPESLKPDIVVGTVSGNILSCMGVASQVPDIQKFMVSANNLNADLTATPAPDFEISLTASGGYGSSVNVQQINGVILAFPVYVRSAANAPAGNISGNVVLMSGGAIQNVPVSGLISAPPVVNSIPAQTIQSGSLTNLITFTGTGKTYNWINDSPDIGLSSNGTGDIESFIGKNDGSAPIKATITVTPESEMSCSGTPVIFTITINPELQPTITGSGLLAAFETIYGTPSKSSAFTVSGLNISSGIDISPPAGYEVSTDNINFTKALILGNSGTIPASLIYIRIAATTHVGNYTGAILLTSGTSSNNSLKIGSGEVLPAILTITADNKTKLYGTENPSFTVSYRGFQNNDSPASLTASPTITSIAQINSPMGTYSITVYGAVSSDYTFVYVSGTLIISTLDIALNIPNAFTPNGDGVNDTWYITNLNYYPNCNVIVFNRYGQQVYTSSGHLKAWDGTFNSKALPTGTYYYLINLKNGAPLLSGYVAIIR